MKQYWPDVKGRRWGPGGPTPPSAVRGLLPPRGESTHLPQLDAIGLTQKLIESQRTCCLPPSIVMKCYLFKYSTMTNGALVFFNTANLINLRLEK